MKHPNKKPFSQSIRMSDEYKTINSLSLRQMFRQFDIILIAGDPHRHCTTWFVIEKELFFSWTERRNDIYAYQYVVEETISEQGPALRIHAVERSRKP